MKGIGYFQNLRNVLRNFFEFFFDFFGVFFWEKFLGRIYWEDFLGGFFWGGFFWEDFFGTNYLVEINKELMFLSRFWGHFVYMQGRRILILRIATQAHRT